MGKNSCETNRLLQCRIAGLHGRVMPIRRARYDASNWTVILRTFPHLDLYRRYQLTIRGTGPLDGARTGVPGSDYHTLVRPKRLMLPIPVSLPFPSGPRPGQG